MLQSTEGRIPILL